MLSSFKELFFYMFLWEISQQVIFFIIIIIIIF